ncbi:sigma-54 interaction domain-containing protein [Brevibacillus centrosporus]|uniref:sigma-54 interaction domain-containing protein n=1 Tax=Brevibacillus centrosporus TaxID=54910 RepID=UPI002E24061E|nr:sigma 54-interacting transcriptional regulator [Brevibacillus centrosporus]MED1949019.1 sigma 54-interacting transcriptional regulator [Brevibacillus centrosporus]
MIAAALGQLLKSFAEHVIITDANDNALWIDESAAVLFPLHVGENVFDALAPSSAKKAEPLPSSVEKDGKEYLLQRHLFAQNEQTLQILLLNSTTDVLASLKLKLACYEEIIQSMNEGIVLSDAEGKVLMYNKAQEKLEGMKQEEMVGKYLWDAYKYYDPKLSEHQRVLETRKPIISRYGVHSCIANITKPVKYSSYPIIKDNQALAVFSISINDFHLKHLLDETIEVKRNIIIPSTLEKRVLHNGTTYTFDNIKGKSPALKKIIREAQNIATHQTDVLIVGETGTGKELFAQSIHNYSKRASSPFVAINCAAIPENLLESTLFGTVKGAFTGATNQMGLFEHAQDGTLFLDEINSMPLVLQSKLIRVLEEREIRRLGTNAVTPIHCKIISASNEDPKKLIENQKLRSDLYYRIARTSLLIPPLRERVEDTEVLIDYFILTASRKLNKQIKSLTRELQQILLHYRWPGNIRELAHVIDNLVINANPDDELLDTEHLPMYLKDFFQSPQNQEIYQQTKSTRPIKSAINPAQKRLIQQTLESVDWSVTKAAKILGTTRQNLQYHIRKLGIKNHAQAD